MADAPASDVVAEETNPPQEDVTPAPATPPAGPAAPVAEPADGEDTLTVPDFLGKSRPAPAESLSPAADETPGEIALTASLAEESLGLSALRHAPAPASDDITAETADAAPEADTPATGAPVSEDTPAVTGTTVPAEEPPVGETASSPAPLPPFPIAEAFPPAMETSPLSNDVVSPPLAEETPALDSPDDSASPAVTPAAPAPAPVRIYHLPRIEEILAKAPRRQSFETEREIRENAEILSRTLENFRVKATIVNACHGPSVTRYELEPAPGVKVSKIAGLADDLALALAAFSVRIEPVPGKPVIGIEVPNHELEGVHLRDVLEAPAFSAARSKLTVGIGMDIGGQAIFADIAKMPHLLVAGATGSGKSVCINTIITSILFRATPDEVKFILIDPKMVELSNYNGIPHLMVPVVTDSRKAASVLNWAVQEMEKRYAKFAAAGVRDMERFNAAAPDEERMPAIVLIIDELADLMMVASHDVEDAICRLAQKARAAGLHLVLATQRPSVDVITGIIKANIPSRISFAVSSQTDSRTILDAGGAEKLLGKGDMLFAPVGEPKPLRVQGAFISDDEVERLLDFIRAQGFDTEPEEEILTFTENELAAEEDGGKGAAADTDELLRPATEFVLDAGHASTSSIQRRFRIGYTRAGRLVDMMESYGIVGPSQGSKPREVLMTRDEALSVLDRPLP
ncbi:MAG: DNA translocase FtsK [Schwartzia sp.]|nr:DNA translocase FtsK [Schwartzia sp. (in: firmicutes)]